MVQNHVLQLLCLVAMEPPASLDPDSVRNEKVKVLRSLRPITGRDVERKTVRGQYRAGVADGASVPGYLDETGGGASDTETFVAAAGQYRQLALGGRALLPAHRQAAAEQELADRHPVSRRAALDLRPATT